MDHTGNLAFIFGFNRDTVAVVSHSDDCILKIASVGAIYHACKLGVDLFAGKSNGAAHVLKAGAGIICNFVLG